MNIADVCCGYQWSYDPQNSYNAREGEGNGLYFSAGRDSQLSRPVPADKSRPLTRQTR